MSDEFAEARATAVMIASRVLAGLESPILASRELTHLRGEVGVPDDDPDFTSFDAIDVETEELPVGKAREDWTAEALDQIAPEIAKAEEWAMNHWRDAFENLVRRFGSPE